MEVKKLREHLLRRMMTWLKPNKIYVGECQSANSGFVLNCGLSTRGEREFWNMTEVNEYSRVKIKRSRSVNFSPIEKIVFADLLLKYKSEIDNKRTDFASLRRKDAVWHELESEFNSNPNVLKRNVKQLKGLYDNSKKRIKRDRENLYTVEDDRLAYRDIASEKLRAVVTNQAIPLNQDKDSSAKYEGIDSLRLENLEIVEVHQLDEETFNSGSFEHISRTAGEEVTSSREISKSKPQSSPEEASRGGDNRPVSEDPNVPWVEIDEYSVQSRHEEAPSGRRAVIDEEIFLMREKAQRENEVLELKKEVLHLKRKAQMAKVAYYEAKLRKMTNGYSNCQKCS